QFTGQMNWVGNWDLWGVLRWSDISVLEFDRKPLILNRIMVLGLAVFFTALAVRFFGRRERDGVRVVERLSPRRLLGATLRLLPYAAVPLVVGWVLWLDVREGFQGEIRKKLQKDYWRKNLATWKDVPLPATSDLDLDLDLDPAAGRFQIRGHFDLLNH